MQENLPNHIFIIPDGNRRWARSHGLMAHQGHVEGGKNFHQISRAAFDRGIRYFTFWAASEDNLLKRSELEVKFLIYLLRKELSDIAAERLIKNKVRFKVLGNWKDFAFDEELFYCINKLERETAAFNNHRLTLLLGYSGKAEIAETVNAMNLAGVNNDDNIDVDFETIKKFSWTHDLPPVDLEIRTGETKANWSHRSSGALPFLTTDSVCYHTETLWPDFSKGEFYPILDEYATYERRFGA